MVTIMQGELNVLGKICGLAILSLILSCSISKDSKNKIKHCEECYTIKRFKIQTENPLKSVILFNYHEFESKEALPFNFVIIDDFAFKENPVEIMPIDGMVDIVVSMHSRATLKIKNVEIAKGDSLVVDVYLKEFNPKLY